jgi:hypothetical protein
MGASPAQGEVALPFLGGARDQPFFLGMKRQRLAGIEQLGAEQTRHQKPRQQTGLPAGQSGTVSAKV